MSDKETFFPNDQPILIFEVRKLDPTRPDDGDGVPAEPENVTVQFYSRTDGEMVEVDGDVVIPLGDYLSMVEMDEPEDRGALLYVHVPLEVSSITGDYTMYVKLFFGDGMSITHDRRVKIAEYR